MRKIFYLILSLILLFVAIEYYRKLNQANTFVPSVLTEERVEFEETIDSKTIGEYLAAAVSQRTGDFDKAIEYYQKSFSNHPDNTDIPKRLYGLYLYEGKYDEVVDLSKGNIETDKINKTEPKDFNPNPYLIVALDHFKKGEYSKVSELLKTLVNPDIPDRSHIDGVVIPLILSWSYVIQGEYKQAFDVIDSITTDYMLSVFSYNRALINDIVNEKVTTEDGKLLDIKSKALDTIADVFAEIGEYSMQSYNFDEAVIYFRLALFVHSEDFKLKKMLATAFERKGEYDRVIALYDEFDKSSEHFKEAVMTKAVSLHKLGKNDQAIDLLKKLLSDKDYGYKSAIAIGSVLMTENKFEDAVEYFLEAEKKVTHFGKEHWSVYFNLGVAYDRLNQWEKAEANLKKAVEIFPENPESLNYLAYSWIIKNKNIKQARMMLESAVIRSGGAPHILDSYGWALYKLGAFNDALPFLEQAAISLPYNSIINDHLGDLYWSLGRFREAKFQWQKSLFYYDQEGDATGEIDINKIQNKIENGKVSTN